MGGRKPPVPNILPNKYHAEPVITKIAFRTGASSATGDSGSVETSYRLSPHRHPVPPSPGTSGTSRTKDHTIPASTKQVKEITCTLPPVCDPPARNKQIKSSSAPAQCQQQSPDDMRETRRKKTRQASVQISKQQKPKLMQNILFNHPGVNIEVVNLQRNWQKLRQVPTPAKTSKMDTKVKRPAPNIELTYYTLSGKEVNVRDDQARSLVAEPTRTKTVKT